MRILIIEDDARIAKPLAEDLKHQHHAVDIACDGIEGWEYAQAGHHDLILLDLMLPRLDGITLCKRLRASNCNAFILMLTARDTTSDKIIGLDAGADDYLVKPFELEELAARIRALSRRSPVEDSFERLKQFTADASHELRNPLMAIKSNTGVALKYPERMRETDAEKFQAISSATNQMTHLTEDLLFLARHDNIPSERKETVNLSSILNNLVQLYRPQAIAKQIALMLQYL